VKTVIAIIFLSFSQGAVAGYVPDQIADLSLQQVGLSTISFALQTQVKTTNSPYYLKGEFPTQIQSTMVPALVGVGKLIGTDEEATGFTTASVINVLAQIYLDFLSLRVGPPLSQIPASVSLGVRTLSKYKDGLTYNFYPPLTLKNNVKVHRPINMKLFPLWFGFTNIPNDADTTSAVYAALTYDAKIRNQKMAVSPQVLNDFATYRDIDRSPMFHNRFEGRFNTGGFMTWLYDENNPKMPRFWFANSKRGERIPFNKNDVDCVVNANVLKMASLANVRIPGQDQACKMLNDMIVQDENATCGIYYPNTYNLAFAMASAAHAGSSCLADNTQMILVQKILLEQNADGSWTNIKNIWQDENLSTAFALTALLEFGDTQDARVKTALMYGVHFLIKNARMKNKFVYWPEDNFFTATAIARSLIMWRSKAYTNGIIASVLLKVDRLFPHLKVKDYRDLRLDAI
jgi:hypothetical protein